MAIGRSEGGGGGGGGGGGFAAGGGDGASGVQLFQQTRDVKMYASGRVPDRISISISISISIM